MIVQLTVMTTPLNVVANVKLPGPVKVFPLASTPSDARFQWLATVVALAGAIATTLTADPAAKAAASPASLLLIDISARPFHIDGIEPGNKRERRWLGPA
ncbi:hypothetical protein [Nocardioides sp. L-11A]|uniref:hypothetical protein n=1 Tax=Nocardioides sp. L-11A TaxID=3043848 RepID=UPI00249A8BF4|nr:hypothetical protein QJ852_17015 [Nocardioides sp. L-11A]